MAYACNVFIFFFYIYTYFFPRTQDIAATPANQNIPPSFKSSMLVTPKFDPRTPLPPGTIKRKPKIGEIAISLTGSPLQVSPAVKPNYDIKVRTFSLLYFVKRSSLCVG